MNILWKTPFLFICLLDNIHLIISTDFYLCRLKQNKIIDKQSFYYFRYGSNFLL